MTVNIPQPFKLKCKLCGHTWKWTPRLLILESIRAKKQVYSKAPKECPKCKQSGSIVWLRTVWRVEIVD